jgi:hypothetical protein
MTMYFKRLACFLVLLLPLGAKALTLAEIRNQIRVNMRDTNTDTSTQRYSDSILNTQINAIQGDINNFTWSVESSSSYVLTPNTTYYSLPSNFLGMKRVLFKDKNGASIQLSEYSEKQVTDTTPNYERSSIGAPTRYFTRQSKSAGTALEICYLPIPPNTSTGTVRMDYAVQVTDLSGDSDVPFNGLSTLYPYHEAIVYGVTSRLKFIEGKASEAQTYEILFEAEEQSMKSGSGTMPNFRPSGSAGGNR